MRGRVLDPDGKPVAGAEVYVRHHAEFSWNPIDPRCPRQKGRVAVTDADGRFHFEIDKASSDGRIGDGPAWHKAQIAAAAPGFAPAWVEAGAGQGGEATLRLVRDDVPVRGRVLDSQGRPVAGVVVRIGRSGRSRTGSTSTRCWPRASWRLDAPDYGVLRARPGKRIAPLWPGGRNAWTTGADGRFEVRGVGRDRIARLTSTAAEWRTARST